MQVLIIGAGIGGLSAAIRLATAGASVTILEKNAQVGGKMAQHVEDGFRFDMGPSVITMRHVFDDLFASADRQLSDYVTFLPLDPLTRYFYPNGTVLDATSDWSRMATQIAALNERDVEGYLAYLRYAAQIHRITGPVFIYDQPPTPASFLRVPVQDWFKVDAWRTMQKRIEGFVESAELRQLLGRFATYVGGSPYQAPATLNVIGHVEMTGGVWYPKGGIYQIAAAMENLALELGVRIERNCGVAQINVTADCATGVTTDDGRVFSADAVISNVDVATTKHKLLRQKPVTGWRKLTKIEPSCSGFIMLLGVEAQHDDLAHHNIWFSADYQREFEQIFKHGQPPDDPTIYAAITSKTDASHAPDGCENWFILVNAPAVDQRFDWATQTARYRELVLQRLADNGVELRDKIRYEQVLTPHDIATMTGADRGALYGASANHMLTAFLRPHNRSNSPSRLYFAGGTTHPGGGVPMVTLSGKVAAEMVLADRGL